MSSTDKQLYTLLRAYPPFFSDLTGIALEGNYSFTAISLKSLEKHVDGVLEPEDTTKPFYIVEFQGYDDALIYHRTLVELHTWQLQQPKQVIQAVIIFLDVRFDPKTAPWHNLAQQPQSVLRVFYLEDLLQQLPAEHILQAVFLPLQIKNKAELAEKAAGAYHRLQAENVDSTIKANLLDIFFSWLNQHFPKQSLAEINRMLNIPTTPVESTQFYKDIKQMGIEEGLKKGKLEGKRDTAKAMLAKGLEKTLISELTGLSLAEIEQLSNSN